MKKILLVTSLLLNGMLFAQSNYQSGYVIKNNGDTLRGFIDTREWTVSPKFIKFKTTNDDNKFIEFYPNTINGFKVGDDEYYLSFIGQISLNSIKFNDLSYVVDTTKKLDSVFIKQIVSGNNLSLYNLIDEIKTRYLIAEKNQQPFELEYYKIFKEYQDPSPNNVSTNTAYAGNISTNARYKGQLLLLATKYKPTFNKVVDIINNASYSQDDFEQIVNNLNDNQVKSKSKFHFRPYIGLGINSTTTNITKSDNFNNNQTFTSSGFTPTFNLGIDFFNNPNVQQFIVRTDFTFSYTKPKFSNFTFYPTSASNQIYTLNQYTYTFALKLIYNFYNKQNLKIFISGGIGFNYANYSNNHLSYIDIYNRPQNEESIFNYGSYYTSYSFEFGAVFKQKIEINFMFSPNAIFTDNYIFFDAGNQINGFSIKYLFGKIKL